MKVRTAGLGEGEAELSHSCNWILSRCHWELGSWDGTYMVSWFGVKGSGLWVPVLASLGCWLPLLETVPCNWGPFPERGAVVRLILKGGLCAQYSGIDYNHGAFLMEPMPYETHFGKGFLLESAQNEANMQPAKERLCSASNISGQSNATWLLEFAWCFQKIIPPFT